MDGMNGPELVDQLRTREADLPAIIVSTDTNKIAEVSTNTKVLNKAIAFDTLADTLSVILPPTLVA